jgi:signal transduction histidine kinase
MSLIRSLFLDRIGGQIAILILASLLAIHAIITASIFLSHPGRWMPPDDDPLVALARVAAASPRAERARLLAGFARAFPDLDIAAAAGMPAASGTDSDDRLHFLRERLGAGFKLVGLPHAGAIALRLPDGDVLTARLPPRGEPPFLIGPIAMTILFVVFSITLLGIWAALALRRPLSDFAKAAENFNLRGDVAALPERGPREIRAVAQAFNHMRERVRRLVDDRTRMLAAMGHDLRTPITRLRLRSEFVADGELRAQMLRDLDQMMAMTDGVLAFLRDGRARGAATAVDIVSVLRTVCDQFADIGHVVSYQGPDHATAVARPDELQRAVANLVDNAMRHGGHTIVRLATAPGSICIAVEDDGPGIPDARKEAMLEAFVRGEEARTMDGGAGFGLGLAIARAIAEAHDGTLTLHDRLPHGLIARITLPAAAPQPAAAALTPPAPGIH